VISMSIAEAKRAIGATVSGNSVEFAGVSTDSRTLSAGELFCAIKGPNFDGHEHCAAAANAGAVAAIVERPIDAGLPLLVVDDTRRALGRLAREWRRRFPVPVVGITGSNGKTTVKQMVAAILGTDGAVLATKGNLNNDIGVPLTLFHLGPKHDHVVVEMGANHAGEIAALAEIAEPDVAVITLCAPAHLEGFGSIEQVAAAKGEIYAGLGPDGIAVINADDEFAAYWTGVAGRRRIVRFGFGEAIDVGAREVAARGLGGGMQFILTINGSLIDINLALDGRHNVANALAAAAAASALGIPVETIKAGLESTHHVAGRLGVLDGLGGSRIIDDTYNANPASLQAALNVLAATQGEKWVVLGDMGELGSDAESIHERLGREARTLGIDRLYTLGPLAAAAGRGFGGDAFEFDDIDALNEALVAALHGQVTVLVKGSRFMRMERVSQALAGAHHSC